MTRHTYAPWHVVPRDNDRNASFSVESIDGTIVANVIRQPHTTLGEAPERVEAANAQLIASAPAMLEALRETARVLEVLARNMPKRMQHNHLPVGIKDIISDANAIIALASGKVV